MTGLLCLAGLAAGPAAATEWFVSPTGNDATGDGRLQSPFRTIKHLLSQNEGIARRGDTIILRGPPGNNTYNECDVRLRVTLTLQSYPGERAHIHCDIHTPDSVTIQIDPDASGSALRNLEISGGSVYGVMMQTNWYQGDDEGRTGASHIVLEDLVIHDTGRDGIKITPKSNNVTIRRTEIYNTGAIYPPGTPTDDMNADGIDNVNGSAMVVEDSYLHDIATTGLYFKGGAADVVVQRNRIEDTGAAGILVGFDTSPEYFDISINPRYYESIRGVVRNNVIRNTAYAGIGLYAAKDAVVANNTIIDAARVGHAALYFGISFQDWGSHAGRPPSVNPRLVNNLVQMQGGSCIEIRQSRELGGLSGLEGSPGSNWNGFERGGCRFVDNRTGSGVMQASTGSLAQWRERTGSDTDSLLASFPLDPKGKPLAGSAAVDAGTTVAEVRDDIEGVKRMAPYNIGAFESVALVPAGGPPVARVPAGSSAAPMAEPPLAALVAPAVLAPRKQRSLMSLLPWLLPLGLLLASVAYAIGLIRKRNVMGWLLAYLRQDWREPVPAGTTRHLLFCFVDHYEPAWQKPGLAVERARVARWRQDLPALCAHHRDADGRAPVHTFFYPEEEYRPEHINALVELCRQGLGEIEIHLHHDDDTEAGLREKLSRFTEVLASRHDALPRDPFTGQPRWAFIHGNWALDNCHPSGRHCGVDNELAVLREQGCYADFTLPAAPDPCQTRTINRIYYAKGDPGRKKSHDTGVPVRAGGVEQGDLMIIQGPLGLRWRSRKFGIFPRIENADVRAGCPPTRERIDGWVKTGIHVVGRPEWIVVKVHTHGAEDDDMETLLGSAMDDAYAYMESRYNDGHQWKLHYVSARETYNIIKAAERGHRGDPGRYRDFEIPRPAYGSGQGEARPADVAPASNERCSAAASGH
ncbi:right-handed parallel beta-helix repeat-containing protein [Lysobacter sp. A421]